MTAIQVRKPSIDMIQFLPFIALCVDIFTPYLIVKNYIPAQVRWVSHLAIALMIAIACARMFVFNRIPGAIWLILAILILWSYIAIGNGQKLSATAWGIWLLLQFPFVCIFLYLQPSLWQGFPVAFRKYGLMVLGLQVFVQLLQYISGVTPGDNLSGLFGYHGTAKMVMFVIIMNCVYFGHWIVDKEWSGLLIAVSLGTISSVLGEVKLFPLAISITALLAILLYSAKYRSVIKSLSYSIVILVILFSFVSLYNNIVPGAYQNPLQTFVINPARFSEYNNQTHRSYSNGQWFTYLGRGATLKTGWDALKKDPITFLFGYGIGTRSESITLGTVGVAQNTEGLGLSTNTSLSLMMQEMGVIGLALLAGFLLWIVLTLSHDIRAYPESLALGLRYALLLFSILWPLWLYYSNVWTMMRVPMLVYWMLFGYVMAESRQLVDKVWLRDRKEVNSHV